MIGEQGLPHICRSQPESSQDAAVCPPEAFMAPAWEHLPKKGQWTKWKGARAKTQEVLYSRVANNPKRKITLCLTYAGACIFLKRLQLYVNTEELSKKEWVPEESENWGAVEINCCNLIQNSCNTPLIIEETRYMQSRHGKWEASESKVKLAKADRFFLYLFKYPCASS